MSAAQLNFSMLLHNFCRVRFQNWIGVVADITVNARQTVRRTVLVYQRESTREARHTVRRTVLVYHGASTRERSSEAGEGHSGPYAGEIRDGRCTHELLFERALLGADATRQQREAHRCDCR